MKPYTWRKKYKNRVCVFCGNTFSRDKMKRSENYKKQQTCSKECKGKHLNKILLVGILKAFEPIKCKMCKSLFQPKNQAHRYCGSKKYKIGCSWKHYLEYRKKKNSLYRMYGARKFWRNTTKIAVR